MIDRKVELALDFLRTVHHKGFVLLITAEHIKPFLLVCPRLYFPSANIDGLGSWVLLCFLEQVFRIGVARRGRGDDDVHAIILPAKRESRGLSGKNRMVHLLHFGKGSRITGSVSLEVGLVDNTGDDVVTDHVPFASTEQDRHIVRKT